MGRPIEAHPLVVQLLLVRLQLGLRQVDVMASMGATDDLDVSLSAMGKWESGKNWPRLEHLISWGAALGLELAWIPIEEDQEEES